MNPRTAVVYDLSRTLSLIAVKGGRLVLQKNLREPIELTPSEARNLAAALTDHVAQPTTGGA